MFGDVLHGAILFIVSTWLCFSNPAPGTALHDLSKIKYLLLLMGFFATFNGFIYNDYASIPLKVLGDSCFKIHHTEGGSKQ
jgi:V-type H+-transporting ATPase subunit a